jgi:hypothetical protein
MRVHGMSGNALPKGGGLGMATRTYGNMLCNRTRFLGVENAKHKGGDQIKRVIIRHADSAEASG